MRIEQKKGIQLSQAVGAVLALVLIALTVIVAIYLLSSMGSSFAGTSSGTTINETITSVTETGKVISNFTLCGYKSASIVAAYNSTSSTTIPAANYTFNPSTGTIAFTKGNALGVNNSDWLVTYTYTWGGQACSAADATNSSFSNYPTLIGLVGTVIFLSLVIGVLVATFAFGGRKGA